MLDPSGAFEYIDVREKRIPIPPPEQVGNWAKAWAAAIEEENIEEDRGDKSHLERLIQALINNVHDEVMLKAEKAFVLENRSGEVKGVV